MSIWGRGFFISGFGTRQSCLQQRGFIIVRINKFLYLNINEIQFLKYKRECGGRKHSDDVIACVFPVTRDHRVNKNKGNHLSE
jgi:hypothetical protein